MSGSASLRLGVSRFVLAGLMALALAAGCEDRRLDLRNLESAMKDRYSRNARVPIANVSCPEVVRTRAGDSFDCIVTFEGGIAWRIAVTQSGEGKTQWVPRGMVVYADDVEPWLADGLKQQKLEPENDVEVQCAERVYVIEQNGRITCKVTSGNGRELSIEVTTDSSGALRMSIPDSVPSQPAPQAPADAASDAPLQQSTE